MQAEPDDLRGTHKTHPWIQRELDILDAAIARAQAYNLEAKLAESQQRDVSK